MAIGNSAPITVTIDRAKLKALDVRHTSASARGVFEKLSRSCANVGIGIGCDPVVYQLNAIETTSILNEQGTPWSKMRSSYTDTGSISPETQQVRSRGAIE